jgi:uncharacterized membrane protein YhaH (DUF805 family)
MSFSEAVKDGFDHYAKFDGRASRPSYWWWVLFGIIVSVVCNIIDGAVFDAMILSWIASVGLLLPGLSKGIRRLHDTGRSGWWLLIIFIPLIGFIVLLIFFLEKSDPAANEYGPAPDAGPAAAPAV